MQVIKAVILLIVGFIVLVNDSTTPKSLFVLKIIILSIKNLKNDNKNFT